MLTFDVMLALMFFAFVMTITPGPNNVLLLGQVVVQDYACAGPQSLRS